MINKSKFNANDKVELIQGLTEDEIGMQQEDINETYLNNKLKISKVEYSTADGEWIYLLNNKYWFGESHLKIKENNKSIIDMEEGYTMDFNNKETLEHMKAEITDKVQTKYITPSVPNITVKTNNKEFLIDYIYETNIISLGNDKLILIEVPLSDTNMDNLEVGDNYKLDLEFNTMDLLCNDLGEKHSKLSNMKMIQKIETYTTGCTEKIIYIFYNGNSDIVNDVIGLILNNKNEEQLEPMKLQVRYIDKNITPMEKIDGGDLVDLRVSRIFKNGEETTFPCKYKFGDTLFFKLGFAMKMPPNKKSNVYPRSGMFKNYGFILTNSVGQIDNKFQGNDDEWCAMCWCTRDGEINYDDRILQFEVVDRVMENVEFEIVEQLGDVNRGGYSSTGIR